MTTHLLKTLAMMGVFADTGKPYFLGGTVTEADGYRVHTFTDDGTLEIVNGGFIEVVVVGRGGNGAGGAVDYLMTYNGGGGGGGGVVHRPELLLNQSVNITIGKAHLTSKGEDTLFGDILTAIGGGRGGGGSYSGNAVSAGGSGGGNGQCYPDFSTRNAGAGQQPTSEWGGYGSNGQRNAQGGSGGSAGFICPITGIAYGRGGAAGRLSPQDGENYGDGGQGGRGVAGASGKQGVVIVRYEL